MGCDPYRSAARGRRLIGVAIVAVVLAFAGTATASVDFAPRTVFRTLGRPTWLTGGDLNGDAVLDLVSASGANAVVVHLGLGGGAYAAAAAHR